MAKPKTRVVVNYENSDRLLFSVRQNGDQSLTVLLQSNNNYMDEEQRTNIPILRQKLSIHVSPSSPGTTISRELFLSDGRVISSAQFIKESKTSLFCHVLCQLMPELSGDHYLAKSRPRDTTSSIGTFHKSDFATLLYHIVVADHSQLMPFVPGHSVTPVEFKRWKIGVYSTYLNFPAGSVGASYIPATRPTKTNGIVDVNFPTELASIVEGMNSLPAEELKSYLAFIDNHLAVGVVSKVIETVTDQKQRDQMVNYQLTFHPSVGSLFAERLGRPRHQWT